MTGRFHRLEFQPPQQQASEAARAVGTPLRTADAEYQEAVTLWRSGGFEGALKHFTRALGINRTLIPAWVGQVQMLVELGEHTEARLWSDKALELFKNNGELLAAKGRACLRMGDISAALAASDNALKSPGSSPARWQARGEIMLQDRADRARDCFDKSLTEPGADWFDRLNIARIYLFHNFAAPALEFAQAALKLSPDHAYCWLILGHCQDRLGWSSQASTSYVRSLELLPAGNPASQALQRVLSQSVAARAWRRMKGWFSR